MEGQQQSYSTQSPSPMVSGTQVATTQSSKRGGLFKTILIIATVLFLVLGVVGLLFQRGLFSLSGGGSQTTVSLLGIDTGKTWGTVTRLQYNDKEVWIITTSVPSLDPGLIYQVWLTKDQDNPNEVIYIGKLVSEIDGTNSLRAETPPLSGKYTLFVSREATLDQLMESPRFSAEF